VDHSQPPSGQRTDLPTSAHVIMLGFRLSYDTASLPAVPGRPSCFWVTGSVSQPVVSVFQPVVAILHVLAARRVNIDTGTYRLCWWHRQRS
jgi:hypothetical protein